MAFILSSFTSYSQVNLNVELLSSIQYDSDGNDVWGYVAPDSTEYAIFGTERGVSVVNLADPKNPIEVDFIPQQGSIWRDIKTWGEYAYVVADQGGTTDGILVIDMRDLPNSISWENINPSVNGTTINRCHNIFIDEFGFAYLAGCNTNGGGIIIYDVFSNAGSPELVSLMPNEYSHDVFVRDNLVYSSEISAGEFAVYDVSDKDNVLRLASQETPFNATHNTWLSDDSKVLFTTDEVGNAPVTSYDVSDLDNIKFLDEFRPRTTLGQNVIPHNVHVWDDYLIVSYYTDGCIIVDASRPDNLIEVGNFDTYIPSGSGFQGAWGAYPFLPSGVILIGDIDNGLFILGPTYVRASFLEGKVTDAATGLPINNAEVTIEELAITEITSPTGEYKSGTAIPGIYKVSATAFGYQAKTVESVDLSSGNVAAVDFELEASASVNLTINLVEKSTGAPIANGKVNIEKEEQLYELTTDAAGQANLPALFVNSYDIIGGAWGYKYNILKDELFTESELNPTITIELEKGYEDIFSLDLGWEETFSGDQGAWERGVPQGASPDGTIFLAPPFDSPLDPLNHAYMTGNTSNFQDGVLFGEAILRSPMFDLSGYANPAISFDYFYWATDFNGNPEANTLQIFVNNGSDQQLIDEISFGSFGAIDWEHRDPIEFSSIIAPSSTMQFIVRANVPDFQIIALDAAFDNFLIEDLTPSSNENLITDLQIENYPNPFKQNITIEIPKEFQVRSSSLEVYDSQGRLLENLKIENTGKITLGENLNAGIYILSLRTENKITKPLRIVKM